MSGLHHVGVRPRSLRYYTTERHSVMPARFRFTPNSGHVRCNRDVRYGPIADISISRTCCTAMGDWRCASTVSCAADQPADPRSVNIHAPCPSSSGKRARRSAPSGLVAISAPASIVLVADNDRTLML